MAKVTGKLTDFGLSVMPGSDPRISFQFRTTESLTSGVAGTSVLANRPVVVSSQSNGYFEADLTPTDRISPAGFYVVTVGWRDELRRPQREVMPWRLYVPAAGGVLADLLRVPANPSLVFTGPTPPANPSPGSWWLNPGSGELKEYGGNGWTYKANLTGPAGKDALGADQSIAAIASYITANTANPLQAALGAAVDVRAGQMSVDLKTAGWSDYTFTERNALEWYTSLDAVLGDRLGRTVIKEQIGTSAVGNFPIYAYTAGREGAPHALLVGGMHGTEWVAQLCSRKYFERFVTSSEAVFSALRSNLRLTFIPLVNPSGCLGQVQNNGNDVNLNRNFDKYWEYSAPEARGSAPFSEPETRAIKLVLDKYPIGLTIDTHNKEPEAPHVTIGYPWEGMLANQMVTVRALDKFKRQHPDVAADFFGSGPNATLRNWSAFYTRWVKGRIGATSAIIETAPNWETEWPTVKAKHLGAFADSIHLLLMEYLAGNQTDEVPPGMTQYAFFNAVGAPLTIPIEDGGALVKNVDRAPWLVFSAPGMDGSKRIYRSIVPNPAPGYMLIEGEVYATANGADTRAEISIGFAKATPDGSNIAPDGNSLRSFAVTARGGQGSVSAQIPLTNPADIDLYQLQLFVNRQINVPGEIVLRRGTLRATWSPHFPGMMMPRNHLQTIY